MAGGAAYVTGGAAHEYPKPVHQHCAWALPVKATAANANAPAALKKVFLTWCLLLIR